MICQVIFLKPDVSNMVKEKFITIVNKANTATIEDR